MDTMHTLNSVIENQSLEMDQNVVAFSGCEQQIYNFDIRQCSASSIIYKFKNMKMNFEECSEHLIERDLSKEIKFVTFLSLF